MNIDSIAFECIENIENIKHKEASTKREEFIKRITQQQLSDANLARQLGFELVGRLQVVGTGNKTPEIDFNCRLYSVLAIIDKPELANRNGALSATWKELYIDIPYNNHITSKFVSKRDKATITQALKDAGMYKRFKFDSIGAVIKLIKQHAINTELQELRDANKLRTVTLDIGDNGNLFYHGVEIHKLTRTYKVDIGGASIKMPHSSLDKLMTLIDFIDTHEE